MSAILSPSQGSRLVVAASEDTDIYDMDDIMWCMTTRVNPKTDILNPIPGGRGQTFMPAERMTAGDRQWTASNTVFEGGMGIDATVPFGYESDFLRPVYAVDKVDLKNFFSNKDIANAIRYAVDNGARVINMSFGKSYSPQKGAVDEAVAYAVANNVLLVHASGNSGEDIDVADNFPTRTLLDGTVTNGWLEVGASTSDASAIAAGFSNYGQTAVDLFAPGENVTSLKPGGGIQTANGTSFASPVVAGVAALVMAYYPDLSAEEVRQILLASSARLGVETTRPGAEDLVPFATLSVTGGVVDAAAAVQMAADRTGASMPPASD